MPLRIVATPKHVPREFRLGSRERTNLSCPRWHAEDSKVRDTYAHPHSGRRIWIGTSTGRNGTNSPAPWPPHAAAPSHTPPRRHRQQPTRATERSVSAALRHNRAPRSRRPVPLPLRKSWPSSLTTAPLRGTSRGPFRTTSRHPHHARHTREEMKARFGSHVAAHLLFARFATVTTVGTTPRNAAVAQALRAPGTWDIARRMSALSPPARLLSLPPQEDRTTAMATSGSSDGAAPRYRVAANAIASSSPLRSRTATTVGCQKESSARPSVGACSTPIAAVSGPVTPSAMKGSCATKRRTGWSIGRPCIARPTLATPVS
jgi:hypothetical protein